MRTLHFAMATLLLSSFSISAQNIKVSVSRGISTPVSQTSDSLNFRPQNMLKASVFFPLITKELSGQKMDMIFGVNIGGGLNSEQRATTSSFAPFGIAESTTSKLSVRNDDTSKKFGYNLEIAPQLSFLLGDFEFAPIVGLGYLKTVQKAFTVEQNIPNGTAYPTYVKIFNRPETTNSGFMISPKFRVSYTSGIIGLWVEGDYVAGHEMVSRTYQLVPSGRPGADGIYKSDQLLTGTAKETVRKSNYGAFGLYAGISVSLDKKKKGKPYTGKDDNCDGLSTVTETTTNENGQVIVQRVVKLKTKSNQSNDIVSEESRKNDGNNPLYNEQGQSGVNPLFEGLSSAPTSSCGGVTQKTIKPDGTIEEMTFACPSDAIYFLERQKTNLTVPKQTQGATFGEKVNQGLHAAGSALSQGASLLGGALPGGSVISAKLVSNNSMPNRISMNVTVAKQTQGATFGERSATTSGTIHISLIDEGCVVFMPDNSTILINTRKQTATELNESESNVIKNKLKARQTLIENSPNTLLGGSLPGGSIISAAVSSVSSLAGSGGGAAAASYAATGRVANTDNKTVVTELSDNDSDELVQLSDGDYEISFKVVEKATSGLKDTLKTQVRIGFTVQNNTLKTKHDTVKNSVGNIR